MNDEDMVVRIILCVVIVLVLVNGRQTTWGHRDFNMKCDPGARLKGHTLQVLDKIKSKTRCMTRCFDHPDCQSINYFSEMKECHLNIASKDAISDLTEDEKFVYCGKDDGEVWERTAKTELIQDTVRLVNGSRPNEGRVEVFYNGEWGTVCDHSWDINDGHVVCKQLGYKNASKVWLNAYFGQGTGKIHVHHVNCAGAETSLFDSVQIDHDATTVTTVCMMTIPA